MICLGGPGDENYGGILKLLSVLLSSETAPAEKKRILEDEFKIPMTQTMDREVSLMCNLSKSVEARGFEKGIKQGLENGLLSALKNLMASMSMGIEEAMTVLRIPEMNKASYRSKLAEQQ